VPALYPFKHANKNVLGRIVGANSVVKGRFESGSIIAGSPARLIRKR
jgi:serine acetyltransferase